MAYTVAITNQKGGVGKTTTAVNLAAAIAITDRRTLLVDGDPQGNTTSGVGISKLELQVSLYDVLVDGHPVQDVILPVPGLPHLSLLPATQDLVGAELQLVERPFRESALRRVLEPIAGDYDYIIVDCPPSLGLLTLNVLAAVQAVIIPIQCEYYGLEGISQLLNTVRLVQQNINPGLAIGGVLLTMYDSRLNLCRQVAEDATEYFGPKVFGTPIPRNVRLAEAPSFGKPILLYDMQSVGAKSYLAVGQELVRRVEGADAVVVPTIPAPSLERSASTETPQSAQSRSGESQVGEARGSDGREVGAQRMEGQTVVTEVAEDEADESGMAESLVAEPRENGSPIHESQAVESPTAESPLGESQLSESQPAESQFPESQFPESQSPESQSPESQSPESQFDGGVRESQHTDSQLSDSGLAESQPSESEQSESQQSEPQVTESDGTRPQAAGYQPPEGSQITQSHRPEPDTSGQDAPEPSYAETRVVESQMAEPLPTDHESIAPGPLDPKVTPTSQPMPRAESSEYDESGQPSKPSSQHLPEVTT